MRPTPLLEEDRLREPSVGRLAAPPSLPSREYGWGRRTLDWGWLWRTANRLCIPLVLIWVALHVEPSRPTSDDLAYWWIGDGPLYTLAWNTASEAYVYSPAFAQLVRPLSLLPFEAFHVLLLCVQVLATVWMVGPLLATGFLFSYLGLVNVQNGNINVLLPAMLIIEAWPVILLTKVTPGVGLLWYPLRGEWGRLGLILGTTGLVVLVSFALWPAAWFEWIGALITATHSATYGFGFPLVARIPVALAVIAWGARTNRRWALAPAAWIAMPDMGWSGAAWLLAIPRLRSRSTDR